MKKLTLYLSCSLIYLGVMACHSDVLPSCNVAKPLEELPWLKAIVTDTAATGHQNVYIYQTTYKGGVTYKVEITPGPDAGVTTLYDCQGTALCKGYTTIAGFQSDCKNIFDNIKQGPLLYQR